MNTWAELLVVYTKKDQPNYAELGIDKEPEKDTGLTWFDLSFLYRYNASDTENNTTLVFKDGTSYLIDMEYNSFNEKFKNLMQLNEI